MTNTTPHARQSPLKQRPLSPHLQIYRWQLTMAMSILHRISGAALAAGLFAFTWMLVAAASGPDAWNAFIDVAGSLFGKLALVGWMAALFYHLFNGIRHLVWDTGRLFKIENAYIGGYLVLICAALATAVAIWIVF